MEEVQCTVKQEYYFQQMDKSRQTVYREMLDGLTKLSAEFPVMKLDGRELTDLLFRLRLDHPEIFYVCGFKYRFTEDSRYVQMVPEYLFERKKIREHRKALEGRVTRLVRQAETLSEEKKEAFIHDFICSNVTYDKLKKQYSHEIIGPLQQGVGVCEGIAKTVKLLCGRLGIECVIAVSRAAPEHGVKYRHAWNVLKLGGKWYHLDATFDNSLGRYGTKRFDYYNLDDRKIFRDHQSLLYPVPPCSDGDSFYYKENRLSLTKTEEVGKRMKAVLRKKQPFFVFHWRGGGMNREILTEILIEASGAAKEKGKAVRLSFNAPQSVVELAILEDMARESGVSQGGILETDIREELPDEAGQARE